MNESERLSLRVPMWCPVCKSIMKGSKSNHTYYNYDCCVNCFIEFVEGREERWEGGWRPTDELLDVFSKKLSGKG